MIVDRVEWDKFLSQYPNAHFLQTGAWGELKSRFGWGAIRVIHENQAAAWFHHRLSGQGSGG